MSEADVDGGSFQLSAIPIGPPAGLLAYFSNDSNIVGGNLKFNNGRITSINVNLADECCQGQGAVSWNSGSPTGGRFGFYFSALRDAVLDDASFLATMLIGR